MKAVVVHEPGEPSVLQIEDRPIPNVRPGWILIRVRGFGLNRSEIYTRQGHSPSVTFPRILGIECVGEVMNPSDSDLIEGQKVAAMMGGMGRAFDGGYAQYALLPREVVVPVSTDLDWQTLAAIPETYQTAHGSLNRVMRAEPGDSLLIRGGTSSLGLGMLALANAKGVEVIATTRRADRVAFLKSKGAAEVWLEDGSLGNHDRKVDFVYDLIGTTTVKDSLKCIRPGGIVCIAGLLDGTWRMDGFEPLFDIPSEGFLAAYTSRVMPQEDLQEVVKAVADGQLAPNIFKVFGLDEIREAHRVMETNEATGKLVVMSDH